MGTHGKNPRSKKKKKKKKTTLATRFRDKNVRKWRDRKKKPMITGGKKKSSAQETIQKSLPSWKKENDTLSLYIYIMLICAALLSE